jgi:hypothetical protein
MDVWRAFWKGFAGRARASAVPATKQAAEGGGSASGVIKEPPMEIDGRVMTQEEFVRHVEGLDFPPPQPTRIFLHHTWKPTQADWRGHNTIMAMKAYYERKHWVDSQGQEHEGWDAGPHLFIAEDGIWLFSDLAHDGVGVYGQNYRSRHIEMVGNYDEKLPSGPILENTIVALGVLHERLGLDIRKLSFHRDFSTKTCPGSKVAKDWIIPLVAKWIEEYRRRREEAAASLRRTLTKLVKEMLVPTNPHAALATAGALRGFVGAITQEVPMEIDDKGYVVQLFAEALIVPVNEWDKVQSLKEYENARRRAAGEAPRSGRAEGVEIVAPPWDPYDFQGDIR